MRMSRSSTSLGVGSAVLIDGSQIICLEGSASVRVRWIVSMETDNLLDARDVS